MRPSIHIETVAHRHSVWLSGYHVQRHTNNSVHNACADVRHVGFVQAWLTTHSRGSKSGVERFEHSEESRKTSGSTVSDLTYGDVCKHYNLTITDPKSSDVIEDCFQLGYVRRKSLTGKALKKAQEVKLGGDARLYSYTLTETKAENTSSTVDKNSKAVESKSEDHEVQDRPPTSYVEVWELWRHGP